MPRSSFTRSLLSSEPVVIMLNVTLFRHVFIGLAGGLLIGLSATAWAQKKPVTGGACLVSELKNIGLYTYDVPTRIERVKAWMANNVRQCSELQLRMINSNRGSWLGHADTAEISTLLDSLYEAKIANKPELMAQAFESKDKDFAPGIETSRNPTRPAPVVVPTPFIALPPGGDGGNQAGGMQGQSPAYGGVVVPVVPVPPAPAPAKQ